MRQKKYIWLPSVWFCLPTNTAGMQDLIFLLAKAEWSTAPELTSCPCSQASSLQIKNTGFLDQITAFFYCGSYRISLEEMLVLPQYPLYQNLMVSKNMGALLPSTWVSQVTPCGCAAPRILTLLLFLQHHKPFLAEQPLLQGIFDVLRHCSALSLCPHSSSYSSLMLLLNIFILLKKRQGKNSPKFASAGHGLPFSH